MSNNQRFYTASTVTVNASVLDIWNILEDVREWIYWDQRFETIEYNGPFNPGIEFNIINQWQNSQKAKITVVTKETYFSYETQICFCVLAHKHHIEEVGNFVRVTCEIESTVADRFVEEFSREAWPRIQIGLPIAVNNLASLFGAS